MFGSDQFPLWWFQGLCIWIRMPFSFFFPPDILNALLTDHIDDT